MYRNQKVTVLIAAAGMGHRMELPINKQFLNIKGQTVLGMTLNAFEICKYVDDIILIIQEKEKDIVQGILKDRAITKPYQLVIGGKERQDSIWNGICALSSDTDIVLTHDGARPFITQNKIQAVIEGVHVTGASVLGNPVKDTIKVSSNGKMVDFTPKRNVLFAVQTPQAFYKKVIIGAYQQAIDEGYYGTDDCSLVEKSGVKVALIEGDYTNIKITTPEDLLLAESLVKDPNDILRKYGYVEEV
ncbi:MAG: 2-C-methyl-D-erythritol 4-phosphate cytidylyltransferase [Tissierellia bacterium]|nr:2-C-methyl-D-erythritol 4-phosphate cytidylyltransferase [Tissierellia bacterium]